MGNVLFDKHMSVRRDAALHDLVVSGCIDSRSAHRTRESGDVRTSDREHRFDCCIPTGGDGWRNQAYYIIIPECLRHVMPPRGEGVVGQVEASRVSERATKAREYVVAEERAGRNVLVRAAETFSAESWRAEWWRTAESVNGTL